MDPIERKEKTMRLCRAGFFNSQLLTKKGEIMSWYDEDDDDDDDDDFGEEDDDEDDDDEREQQRRHQREHQMKVKEQQHERRSTIVGLSVLGLTLAVFIWGTILRYGRERPTDTIPIQEFAPGQAGTIDVGEMDMEEYYRR